MAKSCTPVTFKRKKKGGKILPRSQWRTVNRCEGRSLSTSAKRRFHKEDVCRRGGTGWKKKMHAQMAAGRTPTAQLFTAC